MKCLCGYESEGCWEGWINIEGTFFRKIDVNYGSKIIIETSLSACPECGTIKMVR
jgi:hypothetical protein